MTNDHLVPTPEGEGDLSIDRLRELYQDARGAVLAGAVRCGANEFTGVSKDDAIDYAAAFLRVADQLFDRVGRSAVESGRQRLQEVADLLAVVLGHYPARSILGVLTDGQRDLLADLIDESHRRYAQDIGMPERFAPVDRWWRGGTGG